LKGFILGLNLSQNKKICNETENYIKIILKFKIEGVFIYAEHKFFTLCGAQILIMTNTS